MFTDTIIKKYIKQVIQEEHLSGAGRVIAYHGSSHNNIQSMSTDFMGGGKDQFGPGMYWTNSETIARGYGEFVYKAQLTLGKTVSRVKPLGSALINSFIKKAPDYLETLQNFDENPVRALRSANELMRDSGDTAAEQLDSLCADFYRGNEGAFVRLVAKTYDGMIVPVEGAFFYVMYNPSAIKIIGIRTRKQIDAGEDILPR